MQRDCRIFSVAEEDDVAQRHGQICIVRERRVGEPDKEERADIDALEEEHDGEVSRVVDQLVDAFHNGLQLSVEVDFEYLLQGGNHVEQSRERVREIG